MDKKKTILLEDLFFKSNKERIYDIMDEILKYDEILYQDVFYDVIVDPKMLHEYISKYDTLVDAQFIIVTNEYNKIIVYHEVAGIISNQALYLDSYPKETIEQEYAELYNGLDLNLNLIKEIKRCNW